VPNDIASDYLVRCRRNKPKRLYKPGPFCGRKRFEQAALRFLYRKPSAAQCATTRRRYRKNIGAGIIFGSIPRQEPASEHAANHFGQCRAIDPRRFYKHGLAGAIMLIQSGKHEILLPCEVLVARRLCKQVSKELIAPAKKMRRRASKLNAAVGLALSLRAHADPRPSRFFGNRPAQRRAKLRLSRWIFPQAVAV
jgi:hypothetical protein